MRLFVDCVVGALLDPLFDEFDLLGGELVLLAAGRHQTAIGGDDAVHDLAKFGLAGNNAVDARGAGLDSSLAGVESQTSLACFFVGTMTLEALARQDRLDLPAIVDLWCWGSGGRKCWKEDAE